METESLFSKIEAVTNTAPFRFQVRGVRFLERREGRAIIGDDMGLGKTYQTIAYLKLNPNIRPAVIVCPATLKYNWQLELSKHADLASDVAEGRKPSTLKEKIWVLNYDILEAWLPWLLKKHVKFIAIDECQKVSNLKAKRTIATRTLARQCRQVVGLSGTPISNGPVEFFPILNMVSPQEFPSFTEYAFRYCNPRQGFRGHWDFRGASNLEELHDRVKPFMIRRMKADVLKDLPPKTRTVIPVKIPMGEYTRARDAFVEWLVEAKGPEAVKRAKGAETLVRIGQLRQLAARGKLPVVVQWLKDWRSDLFGRKLVVFGIHKAVIKELHESFPTALLVTGSTSLRDRAESVRRFQNDPRCDLLFGNIKAAGVGLTLTAAAATAHIELSWVPNDHDQAEDRVLRIGQTASHVDAFYFVAKNTIEEDLMELLNVKRNVIGQVLDGTDTQAVQSMIIQKMMKLKRK